MQTSVALKKESWDLIQKSRAILERAGNRDLNSEEESESKAIDDAIEKLSKRIQRLEDLEAKEADVDEDEDEDKDKEQKDDESDDSEEKSRKSRSQRSRGMWDTPETRGSKLASKEYRKEFVHYLRTGEKPGREFRDLSVTGSDGAGSLVTPVQISNDFISYLNNYTFVRDLAHVEMVTSAQSLGNPQLTTDLSDADWTAEVPESDITSDTSMAIDRVDLTPAQLTKLVLVSMREQQLAPNLVPIVYERLAYKFAVAEERSFCTGDGTTDGQSLGVYTASSGGISTARDLTASSTTGFNGDDIMNMLGNVAQQYTKGPKYGWLISRAFVTSCRKLKSGDGNYLFSPSLAANRPDTLGGYPIWQSEYAPNTFTTGQYVAVLGNFDFYRIAVVTPGGPSIQVLMERFATTNQIGYIGREWIKGAPVRQEAFSRLILA